MKWRPPFGPDEASRRGLVIELLLREMKGQRKGQERKQEDKQQNNDTMKTKYVQLVSLAVSTLAATVLPSTNAAAAGYKQADKTGKSIAEFRDDIVSIKKQVDASLAALDKVITQATVAPRNT